MIMNNQLKSILFRIAHFAINMIVVRLPFSFFRILILRHFFRMKIGKGTYIAYKVSLIAPWKIIIGSNCIINSYVLLDGREKIEIKDNVDIGWFSKIYTLQHDPNSAIHKSIGNPVIIESYCWISTSVTVLPGCIVKEGSIIATGSVLTKSTQEYLVYAGVPAKPINTRNKELTYKLKVPGIRI